MKRTVSDIRRVYRGLQSDMPPFGDVLTLLHLLDETRAALQTILDEGMLGAHSAHWDRQGTAGTNCPACQANRAAAEIARIALENTA